MESKTLCFAIHQIFSLFWSYQEVDFHTVWAKPSTKILYCLGCTIDQTFLGIPKDVFSILEHGLNQTVKNSTSWHNTNSEKL